MMGNPWVIGGANVDICGKALDKMNKYDSNLANVEVNFGGVGRNIAQALSLFDSDIKFVTCFSNDFFGQALREDCLSLDLDLSYAKVSDQYSSSIYLAFLNEQGDMEIAMNDMRIVKEIDEEMMDKVLPHINKDDILVLDANLNEDILFYIASHVDCKIASDPVSKTKAMHLKPILSRISIFKPNKYEASLYSGIEIKDEKSAKANVEYFLNQGVEEILISLSGDGLLLGIKEGIYWFTHRLLKMENATGGGDTFLGAYLSRRRRGISPKEAIPFALTTAIISIERCHKDRQNIKEENILAEIDNMEIKERRL